MTDTATEKRSVGRPKGSKDTKERDPNTPWGFFMRKGKAGDEFFTKKTVHEVTSSAFECGRKVKCSTIIAVKPDATNQPVAYNLTNVTILE